jgi:hypothetical protein
MVLQTSGRGQRIHRAAKIGARIVEDARYKRQKDSDGAFMGGLRGRELRLSRSCQVAIRTLLVARFRNPTLTTILSALEVRVLCGILGVENRIRQMIQDS